MRDACRERRKKSDSQIAKRKMGGLNVERCEEKLERVTAKPAAGRWIYRRGADATTLFLRCRDD